MLIERLAGWAVRVLPDRVVMASPSNPVEVLTLGGLAAVVWVALEHPICIDDLPAAVSATAGDEPEVGELRAVIEQLVTRGVLRWV